MAPDHTVRGMTDLRGYPEQDQAMRPTTAAHVHHGPRGRSRPRGPAYGVVLFNDCGRQVSRSARAPGIVRPAVTDRESQSRSVGLLPSPRKSTSAYA
jgi:hypothetical protein